MSGGHGAPEGGGDNKRIALLIAVLALFLAFSEIGANNGQVGSLAANVEATNLWSFYQAKTVRRTSVQTAAEAMEIELEVVTDPAQRARMSKRVEGWRQTAARYESEPDTGEGRKELMARAKEAEARRDKDSARNEWFEAASGTLQVGIVLASSAIITNLIWLAFAGAGLGVIGIGLMGLAAFAPQAVHLF